MEADEKGPRGRHKADKQKPLSENHVTVSPISEKEGRSLHIHVCV